MQGCLIKKILFLSMHKFFTGFSLFWLTAFLWGQTFNRPVPDELFKYNFTSHTPLPAYYFACPVDLATIPSDPDYKPATPTLLDAEGYVTWYLSPNNGQCSDFNFFEQQGVYTYSKRSGGNCYYYILDLNFNVIDSITNANQTHPDTHEFQILSNGNYLIGGTKDTVMDLSAYTFNGVQGSATTNVNAYVIQEFDPAHNLVFEWNSIDYIFPTETYDVYGYNAANFDYCHGNSIKPDTDGNLLVSFRHLDAVYKINHTTGQVIWILGGRSSDFSFTNYIGFGGQHDVKRMPNGNLSLFDNTNNHPPPHRSRGMQFSLDTLAWTATKTWEYIFTPGFFSRAMGNHDINTNTEHLINYGLNYRPNPSFVVVNQGGSLINEVYYEDSVVNYRTHFYNLTPAFQRPSIVCNHTGAGIELTAPAGYSSYLWSTGQTTPTILVTTADTFQVWVNYGVGMLGSNPFVVGNAPNDCWAGMENTSFEQGPGVIQTYYNLLGKEVAYPIGGQMYIALYTNGSKKLIFINP
jgi:hypothetical protein